MRYDLLPFRSHRYVFFLFFSSRGTVPERRAARPGRLPVRSPSQSDEMLGIAQVSTSAAAAYVFRRRRKSRVIDLRWCWPPRNTILRDVATLLPRLGFDGVPREPFESCKLERASR